MDSVPEHIQNHTNDMYLVCKTDCRLVTEIIYGYTKTNCWSNYSIETERLGFSSHLGTCLPSAWNGACIWLAWVRDLAAGMLSNGNFEPVAGELNSEEAKRLISLPICCGDLRLSHQAAATWDDAVAPAGGFFLPLSAEGTPVHTSVGVV